MKRLVVYFHYDAQGLLDEPCRFVIRALRPLAEVVLVTNGTLRQEDRKWIEQSNVRLIERGNQGFDVGAYQEALRTLGREAVEACDELVLMNYTLAGPVGAADALAVMFSAMEKRSDLDFWGLTRHYAMRSRRFGGNVPEHLQSHFLVIRQNMLKQDAFWQYWQTMQLPQSYEQSVVRHETRFTAYFAKLGFRWDSYVQTQDLKELFVNPIMACPKLLIEQKGNPFFKRRSFFTPYEDELRRTDGNAARELYTYLVTKTDYPVDVLLRSLLRSNSLAAMAKNLGWHYILPDAGVQVSSLSEEHLELVRFEPANYSAVSAWYLSESMRQADQVVKQAALLFRKHPLLGVLCPAVPPLQQLVQQVETGWEKQGLPIAVQENMPADLCPPPAPVAGWALVRKELISEAAEKWLKKDGNLAWQLPLWAQKQGYYTATFESETQAAGRAVQLQAYARAAGHTATVAKQLGRLLKHRIQR